MEPLGKSIMGYEALNKSHDESLKRLNDCRKKLLAQLEKFDFQPEKYDKFQKDLQNDLYEAKDFLDKFRAQTPESQLLPITNQKLIAQVLLKKRAKLIIEMLNSTHKSVVEVRKLLNRIKNDYKKINRGILNENIKLLRKNFAQIINVFNVLLLIEIDHDSVLCKYFNDYIQNTNFAILETISDVFVWSFQFVHWPLMTLEDSDISIQESDLNLFQLLLSFLMELKTGDYVGETVKIKNNVVKNLPIFVQNDETFSVPIKLMIQPLIKRFHYHFINPNSMLNNLEKPEWYLCQVEQWITRNEPFLVENVDSILSKHFDSSKSFESSKYQFICLLLDVVQERLKKDLPQLADNHLLSLTIDELILFDKQIIMIAPDIYEKNPSLNPLVLLLEDRQIRKRFTQIEKNKLNEFIESIFQSETSWSLKYSQETNEDDEHDNFLVCEAADKFTLIIQNLIERSTFIPDLVYKAGLFDLIIDTFDDFRLRLSQLIHDYDENWPFSQKFFSILNTFDYLLSFIREFPTNIFLPPPNSGEEYSEFRIQTSINNLSKTFEHMIEEIFERIGSVIISDFMSDLLDYKNMRWNSMSVESSNLRMTQQAVRLFYNVSTKINLIKAHMSSNLFEDFLSGMAIKIQDILLEQFILKKYFKPDAIIQLRYDLQNGLVVFQFLSRKMPNHFAKVFECFLVLEFSHKTYQNLRERYETFSELEFKVFLQTLGIYTLKPKTVMEIIEKRTGLDF